MWKSFFIPLSILASLHFVFHYSLDPYFYQILLAIGINGILAVSLNFLSGYTGQFSMGHAGFMAIGAYASAAVTYYGGPLIEPALAPTISLIGARCITLIAALFMAVVLSALAGLLVGIPTLRLKGDYLAVATLGFGEIIRVVILNLDFVGGARGFSIRPEHALRYFGVVFVLLFFTVIIVRNLVYSPYGFGFRAVKGNEIAAAALGIDTTRVKVKAFVVSASLAGSAGFLFAHTQGYLHTNSFSFLKSFEIIAMVILGGMGSITGSLVAAALLTLLPEWLRSLPDVLRQFGELRMVIYAILLIVLMRFRPQGLLGFREIHWRDLIFLWRRNKEKP